MKQSVNTAFGKATVTHPSARDIHKLIKLLQSESLDLRRLVKTGQETYPSQGKLKINRNWHQAISKLHKWRATGKISQTTLGHIKTQSHGILNYLPIPPKGSLVTDPFNLAATETTTTIAKLRQGQLRNILVLKIDHQIIASARVLPVEGSWEIVSIVTRSGFRNKGLASLLVQSIFENYPQRPLFSFQGLDLIPFYLRIYRSQNPLINPFSQLPKALQRDLFYMNVFWQPNVIITIEGV